MTRRHHRDEQGAVAIIVAASLVLFMALLAFVVDVGHIRAERADAQAAADNAAMAAAWRTCVSDTNAQAAAESVASANGYTTGVSVTEEAPAGSGIWTVTIDAAVEAAFGTALGVDSLSTSVRAKAAGNCSPGEPGKPAAYATGTCSDANKSFKMAGNNNRFTGDVQTGHDLLWPGNFNRVYGDVYAGRNSVIGGNSNQVTNADSPDTVEVEDGSGGDVSYVGNWSNTGNSNTWRTLTKVTAPIPPAPFSWTLADFTPTGVIGKAAADAGQRFTSLPSSGPLNGLYVLNTDKVELDKRTSGPDGATIVLTNTDDKGQFVVKVLNNLQPYRYAQSLLLATFTTKGSGECDHAGIEITTNNNFGGVLYAPNSIIKFPGDNNRLDGSTMSRALDISGSNNRIIAGVGGSLPISFVEIVE